MRVITGTAKGMKLVAPQGYDTRPTADKVKESLFNILGDMEGSVFLDLFAGTGSIGVEALSRGARFAVFVDSAPICADSIKKNLEAAKFKDNSKIYCADFQAAIRAIERERYKFNHIFIDPPYGQTQEFFDRLLTSFIERDIIKDDCLIIIERQKKETALGFGPMGFRTMKTQQYSNTKLDFFVYERKEDR